MSRAFRHLREMDLAYTATALRARSYCPSKQLAQNRNDLVVPIPDTNTRLRSLGTRYVECELPLFPEEEAIGVISAATARRDQESRDSSARLFCTWLWGKDLTSWSVLCIPGVVQIGHR